MTLDDSRLLDAAVAGDSQAYGELVRKHQDRLINSIAHIVGCPSEAEDIVQEAFVAAYRHLASFRRGSTFYSWVFRIAVNRAIRWKWRRRRQLSLESDCPLRGEEPAGHEEPPGEAALRQERVAQVRLALAKLDAHQRAVIVLQSIEGLDYRAIGDALGLKVGTVRSRLHRARKSLLAQLRASSVVEA
jgi:RNA polymerase sigma-70 factor (ECF subfamily)